MAIILVDGAGHRLPPKASIDLDDEEVTVRYFYQGTPGSPDGSVYVEHEDKHVSQHHARDLGLRVVDDSVLRAAKRIRRKRAA